MFLGMFKDPAGFFGPPLGFWVIFGYSFKILWDPTGFYQNFGGFRCDSSGLLEILLKFGGILRDFTGSRLVWGVFRDANSRLAGSCGILEDSCWTSGDFLGVFRDFQRFCGILAGFLGIAFELEAILANPRPI